MARRKNRTTRICGYDADTISIRGKDLVNDLIGKMGFTEMILFQLTGRKPSAAQVRILDAVLVTIMEHGLVPSAAVSRLTLYGAPESFQGAVAAGLLGVGDRFAGTASACAALLEELAAVPPSRRAAKAEALVAQHRERKRPIPGFGHPVHRKVDPRVSRLLGIARKAGTRGRYLHALKALETAVDNAYDGKLVTNVSAAIGAALGEAGVPSKAARGIILTARCAGLAGHVYEEMQNGVAPAMWDDIQKGIRYVP
jgi:citrate synthase